MKIALEAHRFDPHELDLITENLGEITTPWGAGSDVTIAISKLPGFTRYYAWSREFGKKKGWSVCAESLEKLIEEVRNEQSKV